MADQLTIQVIIGSTRLNRFSEKPARYIFDELKKRPTVTAELVDLRDWPLPFFDEPMSPGTMAATGGHYQNPLGQKWADKVGVADGYIIVSPEYNHGYPAVLKNALDWVFSAWNKKPVGFVSYGNAGGARAVEQLRAVAVELQLLPIRAAIHLPSDIYQAAAKESTPADPQIFQPLREGPAGDRLANFFDELLLVAAAIKPIRERSTQ